MSPLYKGPQGRLGGAARMIYEAEHLPAEQQEATVQALIDELQAQGYLTPEEAGEAWFEPQSLEFGEFVDLFMTGRCVRVTFDGVVDSYEV